MVTRKKIHVQIRDENGRPTAAKIRVTEHDSMYNAPDGHLTNFSISEGGAGDTMPDNNRRLLM